VGHFCFWHSIVRRGSGQTMSLELIFVVANNNNDGLIVLR